ncbi:MAG: hypothetical protein CMD83_16435 [Gammaproteobacteria bacterium]|nr:hypothetical protein [Gammaproteobacteria bacterium]
MVNQVLDADRQVHLIDWAGAGVGTRPYSIAKVLDQSATRKGYDASKLAAAFSVHVGLENHEIERLGAASRIRLLWRAAWNLWVTVIRGKALEGNEWWLLRAIRTRGETAPEIIEAFERRCSGRKCRGASPTVVNG